MQIYAIDHIQIAMPAGEEDKARSFYRDLLELTEVPKPPELAKRGGAWFEGGPVKVHLGVEQDFRPARKAHPALLVEGLDELVQRCRDAGCTVAGQIYKTHESPGKRSLRPDFMLNYL